MRILIIDDSQELLELLADSLALFDWEILKAVNGEEALDIFIKQEDPLDAVLLDQIMPVMDGLHLLPKLQDIDSNIPVIMMTGHGSIPLATEFMKKGGAGFIEKPITNFEILKLRIEEAIQHAKSKKELEEMRASQQTKEITNAAKDRFLANLSHELRTPLNAIFPFASLVKRKLAEGKYEEAATILDRLLAGQERLLRFVSNIEWLAQIYTGKFTCHPLTSDLVQLVQQVVQEMQGRSSQKNIQWRILGEESLFVCFDMRSIHIVLTELMDNAMKFSPEEGVIEVTTVSSDEKVQLSIRDFGPGIPQGESEDIFTPFTESSGTLSPAGSRGLGLSIARGMAQLHGGRVHAENRKDGKGAVFTLILPDVRSEK